MRGMQTVTVPLRYGKCMTVRLSAILSWSERDDIVLDDNGKWDGESRRHYVNVRMWGHYEIDVDLPRAEFEALLERAIQGDT